MRLNPFVPPYEWSDGVCPEARAIMEESRIRSNRAILALLLIIGGTLAASVILTVVLAVVA